VQDSLSGDEVVLNPQSDDSEKVPIRVSALGEFVFCQRAGLIARESVDDDADEELIGLGPKLGSFWDYSERRFNDEIVLTYRWLRFWVALTIPSLFLTILLGRFISPLAAAVGAIPLGFVFTQAGTALNVMFGLIVHRRMLRRAPEDLSVLGRTEISTVNWWSLRKASFDCWKPEGPYFDPKDELSGKPWRVLMQGARIRIPVIRKHRGQSQCQPQHLVRLIAYCHLLEVCEGSEAPFGVLMFRDSYDCVIVPNTVEYRRQLQTALQGFRRLLCLTQREKLLPGAPMDRRCYGCHLGEPKLYVPQMSETILDGIVWSPFVSGDSHSICGDRFGWIPPHEGSHSQLGRS
jgi:hypothetical protein